MGWGVGDGDGGGDGDGLIEWRKFRRALSFLRYSRAEWGLRLLKWIEQRRWL